MGVLDQVRGGHSFTVPFGSYPRFELWTKGQVQTAPGVKKREVNSRERESERVKERGHITGSILPQLSMLHKSKLRVIFLFSVSKFIFVLKTLLTYPIHKLWAFKNPAYISHT